MDYDEFLCNKSQEGANHGFKPTFVPNFLKDFQAEMLDFGVRMGRGAEC
jgi:hypothetical protein